MPPVPDPLPVISRKTSVISSPSPMNRVQTHISFEELDDFVQLTSVSKWEFRLTVAFPSVVLSEDMVQTLCGAIKQNLKPVTHDSILLVQIDCTDAMLSFESFKKIFAEAVPIPMRKSGRVSIEKLALRGNRIDDRVVKELEAFDSLNTAAMYKYKTEFPIAAGCHIDLAMNRLRDLSSVDFLAKRILAGDARKPISDPLQVNLEGNFFDLPKMKARLKSITAPARGGPVRTHMYSDDAKDAKMCTSEKCLGRPNCYIHVSNESIVSQRDPIDAIAEEDQATSQVGFVTPPAVEEPPSSSKKGSPHSVEDMTKALLAGLKITPQKSMVSSPEESSKPGKAATPAATPSSAEDISRSLLNLLHSSASSKILASEPSLSEEAAAAGKSTFSPNVMNLFASKSVTPVPAGRSLSDLEAALKSNATSITSPTLKPADRTPPKLYTAVRVPLRVFTPFAGATPLCGLELRVDPLGYRVVRVTEKPGQDGNLREGDVITAIDGEPLVAFPGASELEREKSIRAIFGKRLRDGAMLIVQRPMTVASGDLNPDNAVSVERRLDFGLMLLGAGIDWRNLVSKFPMAVQQAKVVCQSLGIEGKLEAAAPTQSSDASPVLTLRGPAGQVDRAMRQFCVVIVKGALVQQEVA